MDTRVLHLHTNGSWGGGEAQLLLLAAEQRRLGRPVLLWTPGKGALFAEAERRGLPVEALDASRLQRLGIGLRALRRRAHGFAPDVLHAHDSGALDIGTRLGRVLGIPVVLTRRIASPLRTNPWSRHKYAPDRLTAVVAISETVAEVMRQCGYPADRIHVAPSAIVAGELDGTQPAADLRERFGGEACVGGLGKLAPKKNWELLIRTAATWPADAPPVAWAIAGDGPARDELRALAAKLGVGDRVHFLGFRKDGLQVLRAFDALFFPSRMEGASVTVREAMAMGVPVVAAAAPAVVESLGGCGWVVDPDDVGGAVQAVRAVLTDRTTREARVAAARERVRTCFTPERLLAGTEAAYASVTTGRRGASPDVRTRETLCL